jgi:class 3 adenylate cyclase
MARLSAAERARLPDRAFAYVDARGHRRLPIVDEAHVRNALARFDQVDFESDEARERARRRLLQAAKRFRIVPVGFITAQLRAERDLPPPSAELPTGFVSLLMTDIEGSTVLLDRLGVAYGEFLEEVLAVQVDAAVRAGGCVAETRADEFFAAFESPAAAVDAAVVAQLAIIRHDWPGRARVRIRSGVHSGYPTRSGANYIGMAVHTAARVCAAAHGGQIILSGDTRLALTGMVPPGLRFRDLGTHRLRGIPEPVTLHQVLTAGLGGRFPAPRV